MYLKIQKIRSCVQCGELLSQRCNKCLVHPKRKAKIIELYDWPEILQTGPCGCLLIQCQRSGCNNKVWRYSKLKSREGKAVAKIFCCSPKCAASVASEAANALKERSIEVLCSYCDKKVSVCPSKLKQRRNIFCRPDHYYLWVKEQTAQRDQALNKLKEDELIECLMCQKCGDIKECKQKGKRYRQNFICSEGHVFNISGVIREALYNHKENYSLRVRP